MEVMALRLDKTLHGKLKRAAERKGLSLSSLIRMWLIERLELETEEESRKKAAR
jgi:predicted HicB family RNase H-like nuclease